MNTDRNHLQGVPCFVGRGTYHLTASEFDQLAPLMANNSAIADQVKVLDHLLNGVYHPLAVEPNTAFRPGERSTTEAVSTLATSKLSVFPNPFGDVVSFVPADGIFVTGLTITEISGKVVFEQANTQIDAPILWQPKSVSDGVLFHRCTLSNGETIHGKLLYSKNR